MSNSKRVLVQKPNAPIITWLAATLLSKVVGGTTSESLNLVAFGALFTWAWLEIFQGANSFRRILGLTVITFTIYNKLN